MMHYLWLKFYLHVLNIDEINQAHFLNVVELRGAAHTSHVVTSSPTARLNLVGALFDWLVGFAFSELYS